MAEPRVTFGVDGIVADRSRVTGTRVGLVTNDAARLAADVNVTSRLALARAGAPIVRLFSPEHGIAAAAPDGEKVGDSVDGVTGLPVTSLYGATQRPTVEMFADLDAVLFDIPDIGSRFYTYIWTLSHVLEVCAEAGRPLYVLDRPNPLSGDLSAAEGPVLDEAFVSTFVGRWDIPIRHSLTVGELARVWNAEKKIGAEVHVVECEGWTRRMHWPATGLPFVPTSPNMPTYESALVYPGTCLFEGTNLSEGRGTPWPFRWFGAPWLDAEAVVAEVGEMAGVKLEAKPFTPESRKCGGEACGGVLVTPTDARAFRPVACTLHLLCEIARRHPDKLQWFPYPTAANPTGGFHFQRLVGRRDVMETIVRDPVEARSRVEEWTSVGTWRERVAPHLIYR